MRQGFRQTLETYGEIAKDEMGLGDKRPEAEAPENGREPRDATERLETVLDWHLEKRAEKSGSTKEAQKEIFDVQRRKQQIMKELKEDLAALDHPEQPEREPAPGSREVGYRDGRLWWSRPDGREVPVTLGEVVTDLAWGLDCHLDRDTVPRNMRKRLLIERAKSQLQDLLDMQIMAEEIASDQTHPDRARAYEAVRERRERGGFAMGFAAEKMMIQLFRKLEIDRGLPCQVLGADVYQDVAQKIDFIIRRTDHTRGVRVEDGGEEVQNKGIQFTLNTQRFVLNRKIDQIRRSKQKLTEEDRIDDIMLVVMDMKWMVDAYRQWEEDKPPGGPDKFLDGAVRKQISKRTLEGMFTKEELEQMEL